MPTLLKPTNLDFIEEHYKEQIIALSLFFKESGAKHIPSSKIRFGGGTALTIYYFQHRLSFDIDLFQIFSIWIILDQKCGLKNQTLFKILNI
ncbi:nucleotidyl transferase AbiEii/AbiGii toxin family protein [Arcobacter porcinus]|uniref:nucleotidyl transferase AbiEii/AbiGii toxin family protein n=1 Tax=Arcobacter porcinus TaxID=1935204 RepID=UPI000824FA8F|nr:nucleotidyl transferase AbiEii/AbiGii toxin family protein [Arcobacter porcinus]